MGLELPPSSVELVIRGGQSRVEDLLVRDLRGEGGVLGGVVSNGVQRATAARQAPRERPQPRPQRTSSLRSIPISSMMIEDKSGDVEKGVRNARECGGTS